MVVDSTAELKINAAKLLKTIVPYIDAKLASGNVLPALITLGSDQNLNVKYASIDAFGSVAQQVQALQQTGRSGGTLEAISKATGAHLGIASSVTSLFEEGGLLGKKEATENTTVAPLSPTLQGPEPPKAVAAAAEDNRFRRIMMGNFS
ncbi:hypothetical protein F2Q70_00006043 [Brassica cretica]|uniref:TOG domain-containing protein n=1 Tax=Brassica cretica TaxID=69181 RepID=A0A8S9IQX0_BRACR|nr:hypothetical protein F2Q70_00006043 [Brassica cretica]